MTVWFDDISLGERHTVEGRYEVTRAESIAFAQAYDPQAFHLDDAAAAKNPAFGRLSSCGVHVVAMVTRLCIDHLIKRELQMIAGAGFDQLRWLAPVYPGDTLTATTEVVEIKPSRSKSDRGAVTNLVTGFNQHGEAVVSLLITGIVARRPA